jgi:hypothetical protein
MQAIKKTFFDVCIPVAVIFIPIVTAIMHLKWCEKNRRSEREEMILADEQTLRHWRYLRKFEERLMSYGKWLDEKKMMLETEHNTTLADRENFLVVS